MHRARIKIEISQKSCKKTDIIFLNLSLITGQFNHLNLTCLWVRKIKRCAKLFKFSI